MKYKKWLLRFVIVGSIFLFCMKGIETDRDMAPYIAQCREIFPLVYDKLEILQNGMIQAEDYRINFYSKIDGPQIWRVGMAATEPLEQYRDIIPKNEMDAILYLMESPELPLRCTYLNYGESSWGLGVSSNGGVFYKNGAKQIGIFYFEDKPPFSEYDSRAYTEYLGENYWLVAFIMKRG